MISAYFRWLRWLKPTPKVKPPVPVDTVEDEVPKHVIQKGKRTFPGKAQNSQKFPEENSSTKGTILSIWV